MSPTCNAASTSMAAPAAPSWAFVPGLEMDANAATTNNPAIKPNVALKVHGTGRATRCNHA